MLPSKINFFLTKLGPMKTGVNISAKRKLSKNVL